MAVDEALEPKKKKGKETEASLLAPKPDPNEEEMGVGQIFPGSTWDTFTFNQHKSRGKDGEILIAISNRAECVPLDNLVEMRRRDGQTRMLLNMMVLPIMAALKEAEWVDAEQPGDEEDGEKKFEPEEENPDAPGAAKKPELKDGQPAPKPGDVKLAGGPPDFGKKAGGPPDFGKGAPEDGEEPPEGEEGEEGTAPKIEKQPKKPAEKETQFANDMFRLPPAAGGMTTPLSKVVKQTLLACLEGFSAFEEVRHVPEKGVLKGKITLRKLAHRDSRTLKFLVDNNGGFAGLRQMASRPDGTVVDVGIPGDKCWYYAAHEEENPFYGVSMFESAWYHYDIKTKLYYIAHLAAQFAAVPGRVGETPLSATLAQRTSFKLALQNFAFNTAMTHPTGFKVEPFNGNTGFDFVKLIDHHSHLQAKSLLQGFADDEGRAVLIDNSKADASADMFVQALTGIMDEIAESWTLHLMPKYIDWNFGSDKYPVFRFGQLGDSSKDAIKEVFMAVVTSSVLNSTPEFVRELEKKLAKKLGLDIDYDEIERIEDIAAETQAQQAEAEAEQAAQQQDLASQFAADQGAPPPGAPGIAPGPPIAPPGPPGAGGGTGPMPTGGKTKAPKKIGLSASQPGDVDEIVAMAQELFLLRPLEAAVGFEGEH